MEELWRDVVGYEGLYQVSNYGNVRQLEFTTNINGKSYTRHEKIKKLTQVGNYYKVGLTDACGKNKLFLVHRLVAEAFIPNDDESKDCVNHKDENGLNNQVDNLEWCTRTYNDNYGTRNRRLSESGKKWHEEHKDEFVKRCKKYAKSGKDSPMYGKHHTDESKRKMSESIRRGYANGRIHPMLGVHRYGEDAPRYGAKLSEETKHKISVANKGRKVSDTRRKELSEQVKGRIFVNNGKINKRIYPNELQKYEELGYTKGRLTPWQ